MKGLPLLFLPQTVMFFIVFYFLSLHFLFLVQGKRLFPSVSVLLSFLPFPSFLPFVNKNFSYAEKFLCI